MTALLGLGGLLVVVGGWLISIYNRLVRLKVRCEDAWAGIDVQLKRRYDLIPNLVRNRQGLRQPRARDPPRP